MTTAQELREVAILYDEETDLHPLLIGAANSIDRLTATLSDARECLAAQRKNFDLELAAVEAQVEQYKANAERTAKENLKLMSLLKDAADDYAQHCEGGESDEWLQAARAEMKGDQP